MRVDVFDGPPEQGRRVHTLTQARLDAGQPLELRFELGVAEGERALTFFADPEDVVRESDETNNRARLVLANPPDLTPTTIDEGEPVATLAATVEVTVANRGGRPVSRVPVELHADEARVGSAWVDVPALGEAVARFPWRPETPGPMTLTAEVDPQGLVDEARHDNNRMTHDVLVAAAPLDLAASVEISPATPGPCDDVAVRVLLSPPVEVALALEYEGQIVASARSDAAGEARFTWRGERPLGALRPVLVLDADEEVAETDESNNRVDVPMQVVAYAVRLAVEVAPAPVEQGRAVLLRVTPDSAVPVGARLTADGFPDVAAASEGPTNLRRTADLAPGRHRVVVKLTDGGRFIAATPAWIDVVAPISRVRLSVHPAVAGPGELVVLSAETTGPAGELEIAVDGDGLASFDADDEGRYGATTAAGAAGDHLATAVLSRDGVEVARAEARFRRAGVGPFARLEVGLDDQRAPRPDPHAVEVRLRNPTGTPIEVARLVLAVTDDPPRVVRFEAEHRLEAEVSDPVDVIAVLPTTDLEPGAARLVVRAEGPDGETVGVGSALLTVLPDPDPSLPDAALFPDAAVADASPEMDASPPEDASAPGDASESSDAGLDEAAPDSDLPDENATESDGPTEDSAWPDAAPDRPLDPDDAASPDVEPDDAGGADIEERIADGADDPTTAEPGKADCGCRTPGRTPPSALWLLALGLLRRRRPLG